MARNALEQRNALVLRLPKHSAIELEPRQLAIEVMLFFHFFLCGTDEGLCGKGRTSAIQPELNAQPAVTGMLSLNEDLTIVVLYAADLWRKLSH
jgi:hypothetical protein